VPAHAQKVNGHMGSANTSDSARIARKQYQDSMQQARQHSIDSAKASREHILDSTKTIRQHNLDSVKAVRKHISDSLNAIHKYRDSKHYKDSVERVRKVRLDKIKAARQATFDSLKAARQKITDSIMAVRKANTERIKAIQKRRSDSLNVIRKYKQSKRYRDSVAVLRQERMDSLRTARQKFNDSVLAVRKHRTDSMSVARKLSLDSANLVRKLRLDSLKAVRKVKTDSLAKVKANKEKILKQKQKEREKKSQLALELKINQKRAAWSNQKMLKKKWSKPRQVVQNTFTRFNYYYNANLKMEEALANMQRVRKDNYDSVIGLYPFDPNRDSSLLVADMDTIAHKVSIGIQIHDPRSKWDDDLYLLLGEANYYKGKYDAAAIAFHYIISVDERNKKKKPSGNTYSPSAKQQPSIVENNKKTALDFLKHKPVHNEAILWMARTYTEAHEVEKAEAVLALLESDPNLPKNLKGRIALEKAFMQLSDHNYKEATTQLEIAEADNNVPEWLRLRSAFLDGQLQQQLGNYTASVASFKQVLDLNPKIDMDFYARKYMAYSSIYSGGEQNRKDAVATLKKVLNDGKYTAYNDQIYYMLGNLAASGKNTDEAIAYFQKSTHALRATKKQKAITFSALGNLYYNTGSYVEAKKAYDSASIFASNAPKDSSVIVAVHRSMVLDKIVHPITIIHDQDSLLALASLSTKEQRAVVRRYIKYLEKLRDDSIYNSQRSGISSITQAELANGDENNNNNSGTAWYFSNSTQVEQGYSEFKHKWGNRPLADNWRRSSAVSFATGSGGNNNNNNGSAPAENSNNNLDENGLPTEESLLAAIPNTPAQKEKANKLIEKAYMTLANGYFRELEDYPRTLSALDTLDKRYPKNEEKAEGLYLRYLVALRQQQLEKAQEYNRELSEQYPNSEYAKLVHPSTEDNGATTASTAISAADFYDATYSLLLQRQYTEVMMRVKEAEHQYKDPEYKNRFYIMNAIATAGAGNYNQADSLLKEFTKINPSDTLRPWADAVLNYLNKNHLVNSKVPVKPAPATPPNTVVAANTLPNNPNSNDNNAPVSYTYKPSDTHYCVIALPGMEQRTMGIKAAVSDFNTFKFSSLGLISNMDIIGPQQAMIVTKQFQNSTQAKIYMNALKATDQIFREYKSNEYQVFIISADNYAKLFKDHSIQAYLTFYHTNYK